MKFTREDISEMVKSALRVISENSLEEYGGSQILYHFTSINSIKSMLMNNGENGGYFSMSHPNAVDSHLLDREKTGGGNFTHYLSLTRSPNANWGYVKALDDNASFGKGGNTIEVSPSSDNAIGSARITFDGRALSAGRIIKPVDFFGPYVDKNGVYHERNTQTKSGEWAQNGDPSRFSMLKQAEDRLFGYTYDFDGILNYITRIDIYAKPNTSAIETAKEVLKLSKGTPVEGKVHIYGDFKSYNRPDYDRIKSAAEKSGISPENWRKEITQDLENVPSLKKNTSLIEKAKLTNLAVFVWIVLFMESMPTTHFLFESKTGFLRFNQMFPQEDVEKVIRELIRPIRSEKYNKEFFEMIKNEYNSLSNGVIAKYCFQQNPKFDKLKGLAKSLLNSIHDMVKKRFGFDAYRPLFNRAAIRMKRMWPESQDVMIASDEKDKKQKERNSRRKNNKQETLPPEQIKKEPVRRGRPPKVKTDVQQIEKTPGRRGRKSKYNVVIPSIKIYGIEINNVKDTKDAIEKLLAKNPNLSVNPKSINALISLTKKKIAGPTLFEEDIREMVEEAVRRVFNIL